MHTKRPTQTQDTFMSFGSFKVKDGSQTCFWTDTWLGNQPLKDKFPLLFNIVGRKQDSVARVLASVPLNISFRRNLVGRKLRDWHSLERSRAIWLDSRDWPRV
jgi:hypothetical protein